jgi:hypothetical protein
MEDLPWALSCGKGKDAREVTIWLIVVWLLIVHVKRVGNRRED